MGFIIAPACAYNGHGYVILGLGIQLVRHTINIYIVLLYTYVVQHAMFAYVRPKIFIYMTVVSVVTHGRICLPI